MNYEKAYKEALERAKKVHKYSSDIAEIKRMEDIFPELKESEDEMIRKEFCEDIWTFIPKEKAHRYIAWLEKQGEKKEINPTLQEKERMDDAFTKMMLKPQVDGFDAELNALLKKYERLSKKELQEPLEFYLGVVRDDLDVVREEKKPMWTKEDERCIDNCCLLIGAADDCYEKTFKDDCIHYLQSLKERIAPKPNWTDKDEERLQSCISTLQGKGLMGGVDTVNTKWLKSLKQRIKQ